MFTVYDLFRFCHRSHWFRSILLRTALICCHRPGGRGIYRTNYRLQIRLHYYERIMWLSSLDRYSILEGNLWSCRPHEAREVLTSREGGRATYAREPVHSAYPVAQSKPASDFAYPQFHLLYLEPVPCHVSEWRLQYLDVSYLTVCRIYGINLLMFATFPSLFTDVYHFSSGVDGLAYIGPGVGYVMAALFGAQISTKIYSTVSFKLYKWCIWWPSCK
jgi:hypothetical protein